MSARMSATEQAFQEMEDDLLVSTTVEHIVSTVVDAHHAAAIDREAAARAAQAAHANLTVHLLFDKMDTALSAGQLVASEDRELASSRYNEQTKTLSSVVEQIAVLTVRDCAYPEGPAQELEKRLSVRPQKEPAPWKRLAT